MKKHADSRKRVKCFLDSTEVSRGKNTENTPRAPTKMAFLVDAPRLLIPHRTIE